MTTEASIIHKVCLYFSFGLFLCSNLSAGFQFTFIRNKAVQPFWKEETEQRATAAYRSRCCYSAASSDSLPLNDDDDEKRQWELFNKYHVRNEKEIKYRGTWTTYDYMGDVLDSTIESVNYQKALNPETNADGILQIHEIVVGEIKSDCETCFDSENIRSFPVAQYHEGELRRQRCASAGLVNGPSVLRSGIMSTELVLSYGDGRVRVIFQHAPVWPEGTPDGSGPPHGLKLFRTLVSREAARSEPPSFDSEKLNPPTDENPKFFRPVPPFKWHAKWAGTSWTWGETRGDEGWQIDDLDEADAWHGRPRGDTPNVWSMRLPGGILMQCPRIIASATATEDDGGLTSVVAESMKVAWLPDEDKLLRIEASVMAMDRPIVDEIEAQEQVVGFYPPRLTILRTDILQKVGELENTSLLERQRALEMEDDDNKEEIPPSVDSGLEALKQAMKASEESRS